MSRRRRVLRLTSGVTMVALGLTSCRDNAAVAPRPTKTVSITSGSGSGRVTSSDGKIDCRISNSVRTGPRCTATFDSGTVTTLTAVADAGQEFVVWGGDCSGKTCQLTVTRNMSAAVSFAEQQVTLTIALTTPNADDGAIMFDVVGPNILTITPAEGIELVESRILFGGVTSIRIVARGNLANAPIAQLAVPATAAGATITTAILQAAGRASTGYKRRTNLNAYGLTVRK